ncbi:MAG TPA: alanyl-tRNA editing protein [Anaerolineales bacterium]|nr:alanyl-tRNA editing protein [Anaerolineae bacterium]HIQ01863.1 alanyl-tRNA editing protein [Anaerolineales bacterium]
MNTASERLYYADPYLTRFEARVVERLTWRDHPAVVLDRTAFYPTSGGQPSDRGALCDVPVIDVEVLEPDGAVVHLLDAPLPTDRVVGEVDWDRRFDHMQQHTGQHLLSAACEQLLDADTVSFHLGAEMCTIDLNVARIPLEKMEPVEELVNRVIWEDRPVAARFVAPERLADLPLRRPPSIEGPVRLVEVEGFDLNPCGGTHVARTGEIGLLKVIRLDYRGAETRVEFICGGRALRDYRRKNRTVLGLAAALTVGYWELEGAVARLQQDLKAARRELRAARERALEEEAIRLAQEAVSSGSLRVVCRVWEGRAPAELRALAQGVVAHPGAVALLASTGERVQLCVACSEGMEADAAAILHAVCAELGGKGGGTSRLAQGSAPAANRSRVEDVLRTINLRPET